MVGNGHPWRASSSTCALVATLMMLAVPAYGQSAPASPETPASPAPDPAPAAPGDEAWALYDRAFERLLGGDPAAARQDLAGVAERFPGHPAAALARQRIAAIDAMVLRDTPQPLEPYDDEDEEDEVEDLPDGATADRTTGDSADDAQGAGNAATDDGIRDDLAWLRDEKPTIQARSELALNMTINGVLFATSVREMLGDDSNRGLAASMLLGGSAGLGLSLVGSGGGVTQGQAQLLNSSVTWGSWNGLLFRDDVFPEDESDAAAAVVAQAAGLGTGFLLWPGWRPTSGDIALTNTGGIWTTVMALLAHGIADAEPELETIVIAGDVGLLIGGLVSRKVPMSRGRTLLIDTGGILGFLSGGLIVVIAQPDDVEAIVTPLFLGTGAGLVIAAVATRDWDVRRGAKRAGDKPDAGKSAYYPDLDSARFGVTPMGRQGWGGTVSLDW